MANEAAVTGPLEAAFKMAASIAVAEAVRTALTKETGGFDVDTDPGLAGLRAMNTLDGQMAAAVLNVFLAALDARFAAGTATPKGKVVKVNDATYNVAAGDGVLAVTRTTAGACTITVPAAVAALGEVYVIWDAGVMAGTNNITIAVEGKTINGDSAIGISANHGKLVLMPAPGVFDADGWMAY